MNTSMQDGRRLSRAVEKAVKSEQTKAMPRRTIVFASLLLGAAAAAGAQTPDFVKRLNEATTLKCEFTLMATGTWAKTGEPSSESKPVKLVLGFDQISTDDGTANVSGSFGAPYIIARFSGGYLHFMQVGSSGFLYTTTVFDKVARPGRLRAVHTRHEYTEVSLPGYTSRPEQYYGDCEVGF
jgi:hypothetical protein